MDVHKEPEHTAGGRRMNDPIDSSSNEEGLLKSVGPYRIPSADLSVKGVRLSEVMQFAIPLHVGGLKVYGTQIIIQQVPSPNRNPTSE